MTLKNNPNVEVKETISEEAKNYELLEKMIQPLITKEWPNQINRVIFNEEDWTETHIQIIKKWLKTLHNEKIELLLVNIKKDHWKFISKWNYIYLEKWYKNIGKEYRVTLDTMFNWTHKEWKITLLPEELSLLIPKIEENIKQYLKYKKDSDAWIVKKIVKTKYNQLKNAINF